MSPSSEQPLYLMCPGFGIGVDGPAESVDGSLKRGHDSTLADHHHITGEVQVNKTVHRLGSRRMLPMDKAGTVTCSVQCRAVVTRDTYSGMDPSSVIDIKDPSPSSMHEMSANSILTWGKTWSRWPNHC